MQFLLLNLLLVLIPLAEAFSVVAPSTTATSSALRSTRPDATAAIQAALETSKTFGATSPEARVAWDAVEDMDARDNSVVFSQSMDAECDTSDEACQEYQAKLLELQRLVQEIPKLDQLKTLTEEIQAIKISARSATPAPDSPQIRSALEQARAASAKFGAESAEARVAWSELEEIASSGLGNAMGVRLDEECLVESAMDACIALEELTRVVNLQRIKDQGMSDF